jgi:hypothetical protein
MVSYGPYVSVSQRLDQLLNESFVADLGYPADASVVARVVRGLQLLADEIDALAAHINQGPPSSVAPGHGETDGSTTAARFPEPAVQPEQRPKAANNPPTAPYDNGSPIGLE